MATDSTRLLGTLDHGRELRATDAGHHPRGAHGARADPHLDDVGAGLDQMTCPLGRDDVARHDRCVGHDRPHGLDRLQRARLMPVGGVDDQHVDTPADQVLRPTRRVAVDSHRNAHHQPTVGVDRGLVDRGPQCPLAGDHPEQHTGIVDDRRDAQPIRAEVVERGCRLDVGAEDVQTRTHHIGELREPIEALAVPFGEHPDGLAAVDHHHRTVRPLVDQRQRVGDRRIRSEGDRCLEHGVTVLDVVDHGGDDLAGDVLRQDRDAAATCDGLRHPAARHRGHVRDDQRDRRADPVGRAEVDVHTRRHVGQAGHHEHVAVGQVVDRVGVEHAHVVQSSLRTGEDRRRHWL